MIINPHPDSQFVTDEDAMAFRLYQNGENHIYYFLFDWWGGGGEIGIYHKFINILGCPSIFNKFVKYFCTGRGGASLFFFING